MSVIGTLANFFILGSGLCIWLAFLELRFGKRLAGAALATAACLLIVTGLYATDRLMAASVWSWLPQSLPCSARGACDLP